MAYECFTLSQGEVPANFTNANYAALQACYSTLIPAQPACNTQFTACLANSPGNRRRTAVCISLLEIISYNKHNTIIIFMILILSII